MKKKIGWLDWKLREVEKEKEKALNKKGNSVI